MMIVKEGDEFIHVETQQKVNIVLVENDIISLLYFDNHTNDFEVAAIKYNDFINDFKKG